MNNDPLFSKDLWQNVCYTPPRLKSTPKHMPPIPRSINQPLWGDARETNMPSEGAQGSCEFQSCAQIWLWNYPKVERLFRLFSFETNCFSLSSIHTFKRFSLINMYLNVESTFWDDVLPIFSSTCIILVRFFRFRHIRWFQFHSSICSVMWLSAMALEAFFSDISHNKSCCRY